MVGDMERIRAKGYVLFDPVLFDESSTVIAK